MQLAPDREAQLASLLGGRDTPAFKAAYAELAAAEKTAASSGATFKEGPEELPLYELEGVAYTVKEGKLIALKAPEPPAEMVEAGETEVVDGEAEMGLEDLLSDGDVQRVAAAVIEGLSPFFDIQKQVGDLKSALGMVGTTKEGGLGTGFNSVAAEQAARAAAIPSPDLTALQASVKEMGAKLSELLADRPLAARASQSADTVVEEGNPLLNGYKAVSESPDALVSSFLNGFGRS